MLVDTTAVFFDHIVHFAEELIEQRVQILGIQLAGNFREPGQVSKHHRDLPPRGFMRCRWFRLGCGVGGIKLLDGTQKPPTVADSSHTDFDQILCRQIWQNGKVDLVVNEGLRVLVQSICAQPAPQVLRHIAPLKSPTSSESLAWQRARVCKNQINS